MNDNADVEGPRHAEALMLISDLMLILGNMDKDGLDRADFDGEPIYDPGFWAHECAKVLGVRRAA